jgi:hypothetical protein
MEADWEFEIGGDAPVIDALWPGFVDLRANPELSQSFPECMSFPALAHALAALNSAGSPVWTSKCDFWPQLQPGEFDSDELDAPSGWGTHGAGCYIDVLSTHEGQWRNREAASSECENAVKSLHAYPLRCGRVDLVIRSALAAPGRLELGITVYITACGPSAGQALAALEASLAAFVNALVPSRR